MKTVNADKLRRSHFRKFSGLPPLKQLKWALGMGYFLRSLMSENDKKWADRLRNGAKKTGFNSGRPDKFS
jgi:hypothetical protein